ncbi:hypothetical protein PINS_up014534 [Pythium insidiosum]|nr:hypothetical protein PINS_up014534 [Pythium insidiosum]
MTSTSPVHVTPSNLNANGGNKSVAPVHERFDLESTYQRRENDDLFWRKQYKEAVQMRKKASQPAANGSTIASSSRPSLKIFSCPNTQRQKGIDSRSSPKTFVIHSSLPFLTGIKDESLPFARYIGISTRQNQIVKEQHRLLS